MHLPLFYFWLTLDIIKKILDRKYIENKNINDIDVSY